MTTTISIPSPHVDSHRTAAWSAPRALLHLEGMAVFIAAVAAYRHLGGSGTLFAALILVPDLSMLGYLHGTRVGAATYNAGHSYVAPAILAGIGAMLGSHIALVIASIWVAHIGADRVLGYGLKYGSAFRETHLGRV
jgi:hypothetical protein